MGIKLFGEGAFTGKYTPSNHQSIENADYVAALEFGAPNPLSNYGAANEKIARYILEREFTEQDKIIIGQCSVTECLKKLTSPRFHDQIFTTSETHSTTKGETGAFEEISLISEKIQLENPEWDKNLLIATHSHLIGRAALHAARLDLLPILPPELPSDFDPNSSQWWCRHNSLWITRELPGSIYLKLQGKM